MMEMTRHDFGHIYIIDDCEKHLASEGQGN